MRKILFLSMLTIVAASAGCSSCGLPSCSMPRAARPQYCCPQPQYQYAAPACAPAQCCDPCGGGGATMVAPTQTMMMGESTGSCCGQ